MNQELLNAYNKIEQLTIANTALIKELSWVRSLLLHMSQNPDSVRENYIQAVQHITEVLEEC